MVAIRDAQTFAPSTSAEATQRQSQVGIGDIPTGSWHLSLPVQL